MSDASLPSHPDDVPEDPQSLSADAGGEAVPPDSGAVRAVGGRRVGRSFFQLFPQLVLFPLLLVTVAVLVYLFFIASAQDSRTISEILTDLEAGGGHSRKQDAFALATQVRDLQEKDSAAKMTLEESRQLERIILKSEDGDEELLSALVSALGRAGQKSVALPYLRRKLADPSTDGPILAAVLVGLSLSLDETMVTPILKELEEHPGADDWEIRLLAVHAVVHILSQGKPIPKGRLDSDVKVRVVRDKLRGLIGDQRKDVSWHCAVFLAKYFADGQGETLLRQLVRWDFLDVQRGDRPLTLEEKEAWMQMALTALFELHREGIRDLLEEKKTDRSLKVRNVALTFLEELDQNASEPVRAS